MRAWIGIDPGKSGCMCFLTEHGTMEFLDWPKDNDLHSYVQKIKDTLEKYDVKIAVLERVHAMPKQGVSSMFTFGMNFGHWVMLLVLLEIPHILVPPQTWMKGLVSKADGPDTKSRVRNVVKRMFPQAQVTGAKGGFKDGRADALMMAYYAYAGAAQPVKMPKSKIGIMGSTEPEQVINTKKKSRRRS